MGLPPTGKSVTYNEIFILRFVNGRIAETWGVVDVFAQMKQLGVIPAYGSLIVGLQKGRGRGRCWDLAISGAGGEMDTDVLSDG
jgi:SnoaL-like polyketide cyclase